MKYIILGHKDTFDVIMFPNTPDRTDIRSMTHDDETGAKYETVLEFEAENWNEACQIMNDFFGYGPYIPMEET